jgi:hypothetical protein
MPLLLLLVRLVDLAGEVTDMLGNITVKLNDRQQVVEKDSRADSIAAEVMTLEAKSSV